MNSYNISHQASHLSCMAMRNVAYSSSIVDQTILGKDITDLMFAILHHYGRISIAKVFHIVISMFDKALINFPRSDILNFLQSYPFLFSVNDHGYVTSVEEESALQLRIDTIEGTVAALLQVFFQDVPAIHISSLKASFGCFCLSMKSYIFEFNPLQKVKYLKEHPAFVVNEKGDSVDAIFMYRSNEKNVLNVVGASHLKKLKLIINEKLEACKPQHYLTLLDTVPYESCSTPNLKNFIEGLSNLEKLWFFRNRPTQYFVSNDGFITKANPVSKVIVDFSIFILKRHEKVHYSELVSILSNSSWQFDEFFKFHSEKQIIDFFRSRTTYFSVSKDFNIKPVWSLKAVKLKSGALPLDISCENSELENRIEEEAVYCFLSVLGSDRMHHHKLMEKSFNKFPSVLSIFEGYSSANESLFFKKQKKFFNYESKTGCITAAANVIVPELKGSRGSTNDAKQKNLVTAFTGVNEEILKERFFDILLPRKVYDILNETGSKSMNAKKLFDKTKGSGQYFRYFLRGFSWQQFCSILNPNMFSFVDDY